MYIQYLDGENVGFTNLILSLFHYTNKIKETALLVDMRTFIVVQFYTLPSFPKYPRKV